MSKGNKAFTIIELIAGLVILSIIVLITIPLILVIKNKAKLNAYKRSIDAYGKAVELAIANNLIDKGTFPTDLFTLKIDYTGYEVNCNIMQIKENGGVYLSECTVNGKEIKDKKTEDGWYHYNERDLTNEEYVDMYGVALEKSLKVYYDENNSYPDDYKKLPISYKGKKVNCNIVLMKDDKTIFLTECKVNNADVKDNSTEDGYYHYGTDYSNEKYVRLYGDALKNASVAYYEANGNSVEDYRTLTIDYRGKSVACDITVNDDGTIYMTKCKVNNVDVTSETEEDGYYHYGRVLPITVSDLVAKANPVTVTSYTAGNTSEMYAFEYPATIQTVALTDYRYIGSSPNNYVYFNGDELWRIIGVFTVEDENGNQEQRLKIIRDEKIDNDMKWNTNGRNDWATASLNTYLNGEYYNGLDTTSKNMVADTKYYLGGRVYDVTSNTYYGTASDMYAWERGTTVYSGRNISWTGKIALMYPSDYTYTYALGVDNTCYENGSYIGCGLSFRKTNSWIYNTYNKTIQWLLSPISDNAYEAFILGSSGAISDDYSGSKSFGICPTLYLKSNVKITSGYGSQEDPYQLSL